ncbi:MAG TPA: hypothetical protein VFE62_11400, partial [Gemmataceae bacterium]|nr:hypothetical protein [Gemmataceae bacterium]
MKRNAKKVSSHRTPKHRCHCRLRRETEQSHVVASLRLVEDILDLLGASHRDRADILGIQVAPKIILQMLRSQPLAASLPMIPAQTASESGEPSGSPGERENA